MPRPFARSVRPAAILALIVAGTVVAAAGHAQQPKPPVFRGGVELVAVDVQVIDKSGQPIPALAAANFEVSINGKSRRVVSADFVRSTITAQGSAANAIANTLRPESAATNATDAPAGRTIILAVDEHSFSAGNAAAAMQAASRFLDHLEPNDMVGLYPYPSNNSGFDLTRDHAAVRKSLDKITGLLEVPSSRFSLSSSEVIDIAARDAEVLKAVTARECQPGGGSSCGRDILMEATSIAGMLEIQVGQSIQGLHALLETLKRHPGRKILVVVSGGLLGSDRPGGRPDLTMETVALGEEAAAANTNLYGIHMDTSFIDAFSASSKRGTTSSSSLMRDSSVLARGFERFTAAAGGTLIRVQAGTGDSAFSQVLRETSAYYLLAVEPVDDDRDGKAHPIRVKVNNARGATVRSRASVIIPKGGGN